MPAAALKLFLLHQQLEHVDDGYVLRVIAEFESSPHYRAKQLLSYEGFTRFITDPSNVAYQPEKLRVPTEQLHHPLSAYYIASSHNTYLIGNQLKAC